MGVIMIKLRDVEKWYEVSEENRVAALEGIDLELPKKGLLVVNGTG